MTKRQDRDAIYVKRQFVRWYVTYRLSYRDLVAMMAERGVIVSHTTIMIVATHELGGEQRLWAAVHFLRRSCCSILPKLSSRIL
jgi:hypothetical protein